MIENVELIGLIGGGTLGSIATMIVQKVINRKPDNQDLICKQFELMNNHTDKLNSVITQLEKMVCYMESCKKRVNTEISQK